MLKRFFFLRKKTQSKRMLSEIKKTFFFPPLLLLLIKEGISGIFYVFFVIVSVVLVVDYMCAPERERERGDRMRKKNIRFERRCGSIKKPDVEFKVVQKLLTVI